MFDPTEIRSLTDFQRNTKKYIQRLRRTGKPGVLTVNGESVLVVQDPEAYKRVHELASQMEEILAIREGLEDFEQGRWRPWKEVRRELLSRVGVPRKRKSA